MAVLVPEARENRPGLSRLRYRIGTHGSFLASLQARLTSHVLETPAIVEGEAPGVVRTRPLAALTARSDDATPALLDAWAAVGDVLTFYNERIANEGYLRTATQLRSLHELAVLPGYRPRPGLGSSTCLAFDLDPLMPQPIVIPAGTRSQSVPGQGQLPQDFETSEPLLASGAWNRLPVRRGTPQRLADIGKDGLWLAGTATRLRAGQPLLIAGEGEEPRAFRIVSVSEDAAAGRTLVALQRWSGVSDFAAALLAKAPKDAAIAGVQSELALVDEDDPAALHALREQVHKRLATQVSPPGRKWLKAVESALTDRLDESDDGDTADPPQDATALWSRLLAQPSQPPASASSLAGDARARLRASSGGTLALLAGANARLAETLAPALAGFREADDAPALRVWALRAQAGVFGRNAPRRTATVQSRAGSDTEITTTTRDLGDWSLVRPARTEEEDILHLDAAYDAVVPGSWLLIDERAAAITSPFVQPAGGAVVAQAREVFARLTRAAYGLSGESTQVRLDRPWLRYAEMQANGSVIALTNTAVANVPDDDSFAVVRRTAVYAGSEELALADAPSAEPLCDGTGGIALDVLAIGLEPGRLVAVGGERADIPGVVGVPAAEIAMIAAVSHTTAGSGGQKGGDGAATAARGYTTITLERPLAYCYRRETLSVYGNVVRATQGQTRREPLGNGDAAVANQAFVLKHAPVTHLPAATPAGDASTVAIRVEDIAWTRADSFVDRGAGERIYTETARADGTTLIRFGDGREGARLPTGTLNIDAVYREGLGISGNLIAGQVSQLADRPLGVRAVVNPVAATGGADPEAPELIRRNVPIASAALGRLVSLKDYADFARGFAGIEKATAALLPVGRRRVVHLTLGGIDDAAIDLESDLLRALRTALRDLGDPSLPIAVAGRALVPVVVEARVRIAADRRWERVSADVRAALAQALGYHARDFGQALAASEVVALIQRVPGVTRVHLDLFGGLPAIAADSVPQPDAIEAAADALNGVTEVIVARPARAGANGAVSPAQIVALLGTGEQTIALNQQT
ncbi:putative baseplate assembly protein [Sphingomonas sp.]|uniref:putative baseplate assembly protein n=1 Tax=Sphingomonas sp. TaxID=28214 RepID=UPI0035BC0DC7